MAKLAAGDLTRFLGGGWRAYAGLLVFGTDEGLVRETADSAIASAAGADPDPLNIISLDGEAVAADPPRLADELRSVGMFGGARVVHVRNASRAPLAAIEAAAEEKLPDVFLVLEAGDLKPAGLRTFAEKSRTLAALGCYPDTTRHLGQLIDDVSAEHGLTVTREARVMLIASLGADRALSRSEMEKLALYAAGESTITPEMVQAIVSDAGRHDASMLIDRAFAGDLKAIEPEANRLLAAGTNPSALLSQAITLVFLLRKATRNGLDSVARSNRLHFTRLPLLERALTLWSERRLADALATLAEAMRQTRTAPLLAEAITIRAFWAVARMTQRGGTDDR